MIVLDTTVLVYARGRAHPLREPCRNLLEAVGSGRLRATTTVEVIQEYCHVRSRRVDVTEASASAGDHADLLRPLIQPGYEDLMAGLAVFALGQGRIGAFDAVLGATAARRQLPVASADGGFELVSGLTRLSPDSASFLEDCLQCG